MSALRCATSAARFTIPSLKTLPKSKSVLPLSGHFTRLCAVPSPAKLPLLAARVGTPCKSHSYDVTSPLPQPEEPHEHIDVVSNETGQKEAQKMWEKIPLRGDTFVGCSVLANLNYASLRPEIKMLPYDLR